MPQAAIDTHGLLILNLRSARKNIVQLLEDHKRYSIYYSYIKHKVHVVPSSVDPDPDWLVVEKESCWNISQQEIADKVHKAYLDRMRKNALK